MTASRGRQEDYTHTPHTPHCHEREVSLADNQANPAGFRSKDMARILYVRNSRFAQSGVAVGHGDYLFHEGTPKLV